MPDRSRPGRRTRAETGHAAARRTGGVRDGRRDAGVERGTMEQDCARPPCRARHANTERQPRPDPPRPSDTLYLTRQVAPRNAGGPDRADVRRACRHSPPRKRATRSWPRGWAQRHRTRRGTGWRWPGSSAGVNARLAVHGMSVRTGYAARAVPPSALPDVRQTLPRADALGPRKGGQGPPWTPAPGTTPARALSRDRVRPAPRPGGRSALPDPPEDIWEQVNAEQTGRCLMRLPRRLYRDHGAGAVSRRRGPRRSSCSRRSAKARRSDGDSVPTRSSINAMPSCSRPVVRAAPRARIVRRAP